MICSLFCQVYAGYAKAATLPFFFFALVMYIARQAMRTYTDFWLAEWTTAASVYEGTRHDLAANNQTQEVGYCKGCWG